MKFPYQILCALVVMMVSLMPHAASAKCMERVVVGKDGASGKILAVAPDSGSPDLQAAGFRDASCPSLNKQAYRDEVCEPARIGNHGVQRQLEIQAGVSFAQRCAASRAEAGLSEQASKSSLAIPGDAKFSPSNRRPSVTREGSAMVGPLSGNTSAGKN